MPIIHPFDVTPLPKPVGRRFTDRTGERHNRLTVHFYAGRLRSITYWFCLCDCGNWFRTSSSCLRSGDSQSCGCLHREKAVEVGKRCKTQFKQTHGQSSSLTYRSWIAMKKQVQAWSGTLWGAWNKCL